MCSICYFDGMPVTCVADAWNYYFSMKITVQVDLYWARNYLTGGSSECYLTAYYGCSGGKSSACYFQDVACGAGSIKSDGGSNLELN